MDKLKHVHLLDKTDMTLDDIKKMINLNTLIIAVPEAMSTDEALKLMDLRVNNYWADFKTLTVIVDNEAHTWDKKMISVI